MKFRYLGKSGLLVSELTLGTMTFGASGWGCDAKEAHAIIAAYLDAGGNMIDTADVYAKGQTESIIGDYMANMKREEVILASKCNFPFGVSPNGVGSSRKHIVGSVEASLKRLRTDYLDIYYLPPTRSERSCRGDNGNARYPGATGEDPLPGMQQSPGVADHAG